MMNTVMNTVGLRVTAPADQTIARMRTNQLWASMHGHQGDIRVISMAVSDYLGVTYTWRLDVVNVPSAPVSYDWTTGALPPDGPSDMVCGESVSTLTSIFYPITNTGSMGMYQYMIIQSNIVTDRQVVDPTDGIQFVLVVPSNPNTNQPASYVEIAHESQQCFMYSQYDNASLNLDSNPSYIVITDATVDSIEPDPNPIVPDESMVAPGSEGINFHVQIYPKNPVFVNTDARLVLLLLMRVWYE